MLSRDPLLSLAPRKRRMLTDEDEADVEDEVEIEEEEAVLLWVTLTGAARCETNFAADAPWCHCDY